MANKKPTELKRLAGTYRPDRDPKPSDLPDAPTRCPYGMPDRAQYWWRKLAPVLSDLGILTELDIPAARDMVICLARLEDCEDAIEEHGVLVESARGDGLVKNPAITAANQYRQSFYRWAGKFGLDPSDRSSLSLAIEESGGPTFQEVLAMLTTSVVVEGGDDEQS